MAKRGPKRKTSSARRPAGKQAACGPPAHITGEARKAWVHVVGLLKAAGTLSLTDRTLIEAYAANVQMLREAETSIREDGVMVKGRFGKQQNPACNVVNTATMRIKALVETMGLSPASSKVNPDKIDAASTKQGDKWEGLLGIVG